MTKRIFYIALTLLLLGTEILIGLYAHGWLRSYGGDVLVVILIWSLIRCITPAFPRAMPMMVFIFACGVEWLQSIDLCGRLGIDKSSLLAVMIGTSASRYDILAYAAGTALIWLGIGICRAADHEKIKRHMSPRTT